MAKAKLVVDTNVLIDYLSMRQPFFKDARMLMVLARAGEFDTWVLSSQITDLIYILSEGGNTSLVPMVLERLRGLRTFVHVHPVSDTEIDRMLLSSWSDPEDALVFEAALTLSADAIITRNQRDFKNSLIKAMDCTEFFSWLKLERNLDYKEVLLSGSTVLG